MRDGFDEIAGKGLVRRDEIYPLLASLLRAEHNHRHARSIVYRISSAKFPVLKDLDRPQKSHGVYVLPLSERSRLEQLYEKFGLKEAEPEVRIVGDQSNDLSDIERDPIRW